MNYVIKKNRCTGCGACREVCPRRAVTMIRDSEGFLYPCVESGLCIGCGACLRACPVLSERKVFRPVFYGCKAIDKTISAESSSGGVFPVIAGELLAAGGAVFGAAYEEGEVKHVCVESWSGLSKICGSKYVQSDLSGCLKLTKKMLKSGRKVLFSGTPCQIAGLKSSLGRDYDGLITVGVICHGVASHKVFSKYLSGLEQSFGGRAVSVCFRDKSTGWDSYSVKIRFDNGTVYQKKASEDPYLQSYLSNLTLRPSCYRCAFLGYHTVSDLTLGDFWNVKNVKPEFYDPEGVSLVGVHTEKGAKLLESVNDRLDSVPVDRPDAEKGCPNLFHAPFCNFSGRGLFRRIDTIPIEENLAQSLTPAFPARLINSAGRHLRIRWR
ncbi:MAG TPA: Coenzyme F420 hydrogenase/dehydrogenase, beta subunit C-terminal domain [Clostridia bacterium]|nr:Coenzyme F420 hydrogenase/dehydrogenase, beta subunit C-terminal domain [Clostridia bacterium]